MSNIRPVVEGDVLPPEDKMSPLIRQLEKTSYLMDCLFAAQYGLPKPPPAGLKDVTPKR